MNEPPRRSRIQLAVPILEPAQATDLIFAGVVGILDPSLRPDAKPVMHDALEPGSTYA